MSQTATKSGAVQIALVLVGTVIGAGFASGAEIIAYFTQYGEAGFWGMFVAALLFLAGTWGTLQIAYEHKSTDCGSFTEIIGGKWLGALLDAVITLSMLLGYGVMLAGSGAIFVQQWQLPEWLGTAAMALITFLALRRGAQGVVIVNRILTPLLIVGICLLGVYSLCENRSAMETAGLLLQPLSIFTAQPVTHCAQAIGSAIVYASYNMLGACAVLAGLSHCLRDRRDALRAAIQGAIILLVLTLSLGVATFLNYDTIKGVSIPALALLDQHRFWQQLYVGVLLGAMYTTAVADGFGFVSRIGRLVPASGSVLCIAMTAAALLLARLGFTNLVEKGYRFFGYLGIVQLLLIIIRCIPKKENINERQKRRRKQP